MTKLNYYSFNRTCKKIIIIDGISRTGKLLLGSLISSLKKMEHFELGEQFEHFLPAIRFKKVSKDFGNSYLNNYLNQLIYYKYLSRNVNFRPNDRTGVNQSSDPKLYKKRLQIEEGDKVLKLIQKQKKFLPIVTHELGPNLDLLKKLKMNFKVIEILRSPIEMVYSWLKRGLGKRYGTDPRMFTLLIKKNKKIYPWFKALHTSKNITKNECDYCINFIVTLINKTIPKLKRFTPKNNLYITTYNNVVHDTNKELKKISKFLNTKTSITTSDFIKREKLSKKFDKKKYLKKKIFVKKLASDKLFKKLIELEKRYDNKLYNLR